MEPEYWSAPGDMTVGVYAHELAHAFGLPDLYDTDGSADGIGRWALMASGSWNGTSGSSPAWFSAWSRAFLGFVNPTNVCLEFDRSQHTVCGNKPNSVSPVDQWRRRQRVFPGGESPAGRL